MEITPPTWLAEAKASARLMFPRMPEEVFALWLDERVEANGWPPLGDRWRGALCDLSITKWIAMEWEKKAVALSLEAFTDNSRDIIRHLIDAAFYGRPNYVSQYVRDSEARITSAREFILRQRQVPGTVVLLEIAERFEIVDGCHRLATLCYIQREPNAVVLTPHDHIAWVANAN